MQYNRVTTNPIWRMDATLKIVLGSQRPIVGLLQNLEWWSRITCWHRWRYQNNKFRKFKMADGRHHENVFSIFPTAIQWNFMGRRKLYFWLDEKSKFPDPRCERAPYLKSFSGYISAPYCLIKAKLEVTKQSHMMAHGTRPALQISKIQDGGRPPVSRWIYLYLSRE